MTNPTFYTKNQILSVSEIATSSGDNTSNKTRLIDRNTLNQFTTISQTSGTRTITWTPTSSKTITAMFFQNINWKNFHISYNGGSDFNIVINITGNTNTDLYFEVSSTVVTSVLISVTDTITASENVKCGEMYFGSKLFEVSGGGEYFYKPYHKQIMNELSDGSEYRNFIRTVMNYELIVKMIDDTDILNYRSLYTRNRRESFVFIPFPLMPTSVGGVITFPFVFTATFGSDVLTFGQWDGLADHYNLGADFDIYNFEENLMINGRNGILPLRKAAGIG